MGGTKRWGNTAKCCSFLRRAAEVLDEKNEGGDFARQDFAVAAFGVGVVLMVLLLV